ncbi:MAG: SRPBCC family protein [Hellea sp.]
MLNFTIEVDIDKPRDRVVELMHLDYLSEWMPGFVKMEHMSGRLWEEGSTYDLYFKTGNVAYKVTETFMTWRLPERFACTFEDAHMFQTSANWLEVLPNGRTRWTSTQSVMGKSLSTKLMMKVIPWVFKSYVKKNFTLFKEFVEQY